MLLMMFVIGLITGLVLGLGVTVIWYDDEVIEELMERKNAKD